MSDDRSTDEHLPFTSGEAAREPWYERLLQLFHLKSRDSVRDDIEEVLAETGEDADVSPKERTMLKNVLGLHRVRVDDVMVPRSEVVAVSADTPVAQLLGVFRSVGHSRLPVYGENLDDAKGMVHIRDVVSLLAAQIEAATPPLDDRPTGSAPGRCTLDLSMKLQDANIVRTVLFAPPSMPAIDLLVRMQATHTHMALVVDEYGGTDGLVTIEDLVERVVGDIEDEHDVNETLIVRQSDDGTFLADARASLEEVSEALKLDLVSHGEAEDIDTLGGLVTTLAGRVPSRGEVVTGPSGLEFEVLEADPRRLKRVRIRHVEVGPSASASSEDALISSEPGAAPARRSRPKSSAA